jgi:glucan 1,3-beta-glucosidase
MNDLIFNGGNTCLQIGNQQFTIRNIAFNNEVTTVSQLRSRGRLYQGLQINNCRRGIDIITNGRTGWKAGTVVVIDSTITKTPDGIITAFDSVSSQCAAGSLILENIVLNDVATAVQQAGGGLFGKTAPQQSRDRGKGTSTT